MGKYVLAYQGGSMAETPEAQEQVMAAWGAWFGSLGAAIVDGGAPFGESTAVGGGAASSSLTGYSILEAADLKAAAKLAEGCPVLSSGGSVDVYEAIDVSGGM
jgi:hypothetical protein